MVPPVNEKINTSDMVEPVNVGCNCGEKSKAQEVITTESLRPLRQKLNECKVDDFGIVHVPLHSKLKPMQRSYSGKQNDLTLVVTPSLESTQKNGSRDIRNDKNKDQAVEGSSDLEKRLAEVEKMIRKNKEAMGKMKSKAAAKIQAVARGYIQRRYGIQSRCDAAMNVTKSRYATQIQRVVRSYLQSLKQAREQSKRALEVTQARYAIKIQRAARTFLRDQREAREQGRQALELTKGKYAIKIQRVVRRFLRELDEAREQTRRALQMAMAADQSNIQNHDSYNIQESADRSRLALETTKGRFATKIQRFIRKKSAQKRKRNVPINYDYISDISESYATPSNVGKYRQSEPQGQAPFQNETDAAFEDEEQIKERLRSIEAKMRLYQEELEHMNDEPAPKVETRQDPVLTRSNQCDYQTDYWEDKSKDALMLTKSRYAVIIQSLIRGCLCRRKLRKSMQKIELKVNKVRSAKKIQSLIRGWQQRRIYSLDALGYRLEKIDKDRLSSLKLIEERKSKKLAEMKEKQAAKKIKEDPEEYEKRKKLVSYLRKENVKLKSSREKMKKQIKDVNNKISKLTGVNSSWVCSVGRMEVEVKNLELNRDNLLDVSKQYEKSIEEIQSRVDDYNRALRDDKRLMNSAKEFIVKSVEMTNQRCKNKKLREEIVRISKQVAV